MTFGAAGPVIAITGPTASGKSVIADAVAYELGTSIVSCDAMQVYRGMDIGTAKMPPQERKAPLLMVDVIDLGVDYSVSLYQHAARACVDELLVSGRTALICGGTGLYLDAVIDEMRFPAGETGGESRKRWEDFAREHGTVALHAELVSRDAESAALLHPNNVRRVVRALELWEGGVSYAEQHRGLRDHVPHYSATIWGVTMSRERLYARIGERVDKMFAEGLVDEVRALADDGLRTSRTARQAIGYKEVLDYLEGTCSLADARETVALRTRRYAKRQLSWLRRDGRVRWLDLDALSVREAVRLVTDDAAAQLVGRTA